MKVRIPAEDPQGFHRKETFSYEFPNNSTLSSFAVDRRIIEGTNQIDVNQGEKDYCVQMPLFPSPFFWALCDSLFLSAHKRVLQCMITCVQPFRYCVHRSFKSRFGFCYLEIWIQNGRNSVGTWHRESTPDITHFMVMYVKWVII